MIQKYQEQIILLSVSTLLLCVCGIYNGYPLVTSDSGAYIQHAFSLYVPKDRPIFYGIFIRVFSLSFSLWTVIIAQSFITAFLLYRTLHLIFDFSMKSCYIVILLTVVFSGVSWYTSQIMPDIFTSIVYLASIIFLTTNNKTENQLMVPLILFSIVVHNSNLITSFLFYSIIGFACILKKQRLYFYKSIRLIAISVLAWITVSMTNFISVHCFVISQSSHVFIMGKLAENGILKIFLDDNCDKVKYKLCAYKNDLPKHAWDFIWSNDGAFAKTGGWDSSKQEYEDIIKQTLTTPKYIKLHIKESIKATGEQILLTDVGGGLWAYLDGTNPFWKVQEFFHWEMRKYLSSRQNTGRLHFDLINSIYKISLITVFIISIFIIILTKNKILQLLLCSGLLFSILNAFTTATFANVLERLNSRDIWILFFLAIAVITDYIGKLYFNMFSLIGKSRAA